MKKNCIISVLLMLGTVLTAGCQYDPDAHTYVTTKPSDSDVVGVYQFERQYVDTSAKVAGTPRISLSADHTFELIDFPEWKEGKSPADWELKGSHSTKGSWKVEVVGGVDDGVKEKKVYGVRFEDSGGTIFSNLTQVQGKRGLCFGYGDPDEGKSMTFLKTK